MIIDGKRLISNLVRLRKLTDTPGAGVTRFSYGEQDAKARQFLVDRAREMGCTVRADRVGNLRIGLPSNRPGRPVILCGSHIDTVRNGGWLDGIYGVCSALEVLETLAARDGNETAGGDDGLLNVDMVIFAEEEGSNFGSTMTGSKFLTGKYGEEDLDRLTDDHGSAMRKYLERAGLGTEGGTDHQFLDPVPWDLSQAAAMLELHIEQGPVLDRAGIPIGIVDAIFGMRVLEVTLTGVGNHAGATPMDERFDAMTAAAECILAAEATVAADPEKRTVVTIGKIEALPNCSNVIPETVRFTMEVRNRDKGKIDGYTERIAHGFRQIAMDRGISCQIRDHSSSEPLPLDEGIGEVIRQTAERAGIPYRVMDSGAVHDACMLAEAGVPTGMIFVPSIDGRSHVPQEDTKEEDLIRGAKLLLETVEQLRAHPPQRR
ncbi:MAG: M20 family metallo-hydrolase [Firmicutes bacterium]|nr:M20 family metallo-hydrolase [Bacillota bacterium]